MAERTLTFNGFSKAYAMTGWRLGYVAGPVALIDRVRAVHGHMVTCATSFSQPAGVAALNGPQGPIGEMVEAWDRRRKLVCRRLSAVGGLKCPLPEGAFYAFVDIRSTGLGSVEAAERLLSEQFVAVTPGVAFGEAGEGHLRLSYATGDALLERAVERMARLFHR
jgi:aspartate aminotransferase